MSESRPTARPYDRVTVREVTKFFGATRALAGVSIEFPAGKVTSLEGANGAGKSTLLSIVATLSRPTSGTVRYGTLDPSEDLDLIRPTIGLVAHDSMVDMDLPVEESLRLHARLYRVPDVGGAVARVMAAQRLEPLAHQRARTLSRGQLQRVSLARASLHDPTLRLYDEPTTGLDRASVERLTESVRGARDAGAIVIVVTHDREWAAAVADTRVVLERGRLQPVAS